jgi:hypothetical protein
MTISLKENTRLANPVNRNELILGKLRISHTTERLDELEEICLKYNIFRSPVDRLTTTKTAVHSIPTPSVMPGRAKSLKIIEFLNITRKK